MKPMTPSSLRWALTAALLAVAACEQPVPVGGDPLGSPCQPNGERANCTLGAICVEGKCQTADTTHTCTPNAVFCEDGNVTKCNEIGTGKTISEHCGAGCDNGACLSVLCEAGDLRCDGNELKKCNAARSGWDTFQVCDLGCTENNTTTPKTVACVEPTCSPGSRRCSPTGKLETCNPRGSEWTASECDPGVCVQEGTGASATARCVRGGCTPNETRCEGSDIVRCSTDGTTEVLEKACVSGCTTDATGTPSCPPPVCTPNARRCAANGTSVERCDSLGMGWVTQPCSEDGLSVCREVPGATGGAATAQCVRFVCDPGTIRCTNDERWECEADGLSEKRVESCAFGCGEAGACAQPACNVGQARCNGDNIEVCRADRRGYSFEQPCSAGCSADPARGARCNVGICSPLTARCASSGNAVERCRADGRGWDPAQACQPGQTCEAGGCVSTAPACVAGESRCAAGNLERCESAAGKPLSYNQYGACLGSCDGDTCDAAGECAPFGLRVAQVAEGEALPADGRSTFLVLSDLLKGPSGLPVPDGTLVTVALDTPGTNVVAAATFASGDADPLTAGLQVRVVEGRIDFVVRAPKLGEGTAVTTLRGLIGDHTPCAGALELNFDTAAPGVFAAEDFSTTRNRDGTASSGGWDTTKGVLTVRAFDAGDGRDGELNVASGTRTLDQSFSNTGRTYGDMYSARVVEIRGNLIAVEGSLAAFTEPGTRMLLVNMQGTVGAIESVGAFEYVTTDGIQGAFIRTRTPVLRRYGQGGNGAAELSTQKVRLIRVPQYKRVGVAAGATLNALPWDGTLGGVLVFFSSNSPAAGQSGSSIAGSVTMSSRGFRGGGLPGSNLATTAGEGLEGQLNANTPNGGPGASGGGYLCGSNFVRPAQCSNSNYGVNGCGGANNCDAISNSVYGNVTRSVLAGSAGSHATRGASTCSGYGPGSIYGDGNLNGIFLGGGSGSVARSQAHSCTEQETCCRTGNGDCCQHTQITGAITTGSSYCAGCVTSTYCRGRGDMWNGRYAGNPGGGIVLITAVDMNVTGSVTSLGQAFTVPAAEFPSGSHVFYNTSTSFGGAGGTVYIRADNLVLNGPGRVDARGQSGGGDGRVRIDVAKADPSFADTWASPRATVLRLESSTVRSLPVLRLDANEIITTAAALVLPSGAPVPENDTTGAIDASRALQSSQIALTLSADGTTFGLVDSDGNATFGAPSLPRGRTARWAISPAAAASVGSTRGFSVKFTKEEP